MVESPEPRPEQLVFQPSYRIVQLDVRAAARPWYGRLAAARRKIDAVREAYNTGKFLLGALTALVAIVLAVVSWLA